MRAQFVFIAALVFCCTVYCTESFAQVLVGPVVGVNTNWVAYKDKELKDVYDITPYIGFHAGASISFRVQKRFFLQTSVLYSQKGKKVKEDKDKIFHDGDFSNKLKLNYLEMPILYTAEFKGKLGKKSNKEFKWYLGVGPTISYWLGGKGELSDGDLLENDPQNNPLSYKITFNKAPGDVKKGEMNVADPNRVQLSLNVSAGLILEPVGLNKFMISMRYEFGHSFLSGTSDGYFGGYDGDLYYEEELQVRMQTLLLSVNYYIDLKTDQRKKGKSTSKIKKGRSKN